MPHNNFLLPQQSTGLENLLAPAKCSTRQEIGHPLIIILGVISCHQHLWILVQISSYIYSFCKGDCTCTLAGLLSNCLLVCFWEQLGFTLTYYLSKIRDHAL